MFSFFVVLSCLEMQDSTKLFSLEYIETTENCIDLSPIQFTPTTGTRQSCLVRVGGVN